MAARLDMVMSISPAPTSWAVDKKRAQSLMRTIIHIRVETAGEIQCTSDMLSAFLKFKFTIFSNFINQLGIVVSDHSTQVNSFFILLVYGPTDPIFSFFCK